MKFSSTLLVLSAAMPTALKAANGQEVIFDIDESVSMVNGNSIYPELPSGSRIGYGTHLRGPTNEAARVHMLALTDDQSSFELAADELSASAGGERGYDLVIKPGNCPNPINMREGGAVLPAAIVGTDVHSIDTDSILLEDVCSPVKWNYEDVAAPYEDRFRVVPPENNCTRDRSDGHEDLILKFDRACVHKAMGPVTGTEVRLIKVTGKYDKHGEARDFEAYDIVRLMNKCKKNLRK